MSNYNSLIITGPTGSGKTLLSEMIASELPCEIINADVGQFYKPLCIGTAKPDLNKVFYVHHLFDLLDEPEDLNVIQYRELVVNLVKDICEKDKIPLIVGGSLFYIKSIFFPPYELEESRGDKSRGDNKFINIKRMDSTTLWNLLKEVDPERAKMLHPNDTYRVIRALEIWKQTGIKPSVYEPKFYPPFNALIVYINLDKNLLEKRIRQRTVQMIKKEGWIEETEKLSGTVWEPFLRNKGLVGYTAIFDWIRDGKKRSSLPDLINQIQIQTIQYAKRQKTFWKSFKKQISERDKVLTLEVDSLDNALKPILEKWKEFTVS